MEILSDLLFDYTLRTVAIGSALLGIVSGVLGSYVVLRRQSLLGDAMSHAALPGIALAFLISGSKNSIFLLLGAGLSGWFVTLLIFTVVKNSKIKFDSALAMGLSVFFGLGLVLLTIIQKMPDASQAGLDKFLFGQAAALTTEDIKIMGVLGGISIILVLIFWKEFKISTFDPEFAASIGLRVKFLDILITSLVVIAIVLGLQTVGVVLMSSMIVAPAVAARQWTDRLGLMMALSGFFGALAGVIGSLISSLISRMPTGPTIVVTISAIVFLSIFFSPKHGIIIDFVKKRKNKESLRLDAILEEFFKLGLKHNNPRYPHSIKLLKIIYSNYTNFEKSLVKLKDRGFIAQVEGDKWALTETGVTEMRNKKVTTDNK